MEVTWEQFHRKCSRYLSLISDWNLIIQDHSCICQVPRVNSLAPGKIEWNFRSLIFQIISVIDGWGISCELALRWMSLDLTDDKSTLVQVMAWCRQATSYYLSQCWPRLLSPYGVTRPQCVKTMRQTFNICLNSLNDSNVQVMITRPAMNKIDI